MLKTLLVGYGFSATTFHLPFIRYIKEYSLCGVVTSRPEVVNEALPQCPTWPELTTALQEATPDLVIITTPNHLHAEQTRLALTAGCHVLVEKPFTLSSSDAKALVSLAEQQKRKLCVFHNRRFDGDFLTLTQLIAHQRLGNIKRLESRFDRFRPIPRARWREQPGLGSGIFWDLGPHLIDQALQLFGNPQFVSAHIETLRQGSETDDSFELTLYYEDKWVLLGSSPFQAATTLRFDLQGTTGSYRKFGLDPQEAQLRSAMALDAPEWATTPTKEDGYLYDASGGHPHPTERGNYLGFYTQLATAIVTDQTPPAPASSVIDVIAVMERLIESAMQQQRLVFQLED
jgi:predicted dehydrogenase